ncbi:hypothetical protein ACFLQ0_03295 [Nitrospinota bacterium]
MEKEGRRYPRYSLPILIEAPSLAGHPLVPEDISRNGFRVEAAEEPLTEDLIECSIVVNGKLFEGWAAKAEWVRNNEVFLSSWSIGLSVGIEEGRPEEFRAALEEVLENPRGRPPGFP